MSSPLFQAATAGESYVEPDYDLIQEEQDRVDEGLWESAGPTGYRPALVGDDELVRIKEDMRLNRIQITPDTLRHALEAEEIRKMLRRMGIRSLRKVAASRDYRGLVKLEFGEFRELVERLMGMAVEDTEK